MSFHTDPARWYLQSKKEHCPYCLKADDPTDSVTLEQFETSELCAHPLVPLKGTCYLISREHYVELFDMDEEQLTGLMKDAQLAARVLKEVTGAFRINYEIHGNTVPHLHIHLIPRYINDRFAGKPIDFRNIEASVYASGEFDRFVGEMKSRLNQAFRSSGQTVRT